MSFIYLPQANLFRGTLYKVDPEIIFLTVAFILFIYWIIKELKKENLELKTKDSFWFILVIILGAMGGGRLWFVIDNWKWPNSILTILNPSVGGLTSFGMILGGMISISLFINIYNKKNKIEENWVFLSSRYLDIIAVASALFIFIYRMGCFHFGDVPGTPTNLPWRMFAVQYGQFTGTIMHPTALYLSFSALLIFLFLNIFKIEKTKRNKFGKRFDGEISLWFLMLYSFNRLWIEFFRLDSTRYLYLNQGQWICLLLFLISIIYLIRNYNLLSLKNLKYYKEWINWRKTI